MSLPLRVKTLCCLGSGQTASDWFALACITLLAVFLQGCQVESTVSSGRKPADVVLDSELDLETRAVALAQLGSEDAVTLAEVVWSDRQPEELREPALQRVLELDPNGFWRSAPPRLPRVDHLGMLKQICEAIPASQRDRLRGALIRSWARPSRTWRDEQRPEALALAGNPLGVEAVDAKALIRMQWLNSTEPPLHAWDILRRTHTDEALSAWLLQGAEPRGWLGEVTAQHRLVGDWPDGRFEVAGVVALWGALRDADQVHPLRERVEALNATQSKGLARRHLPLLLVSSMDQMTLDAGVRLDQAMQRSRPVIRDRWPERSGVTMQLLHTPEHWRKLPWGDRAIAGLVVRALHSPAIQAGLARMLREDLADATAEHGGGLFLDHDMGGHPPVRLQAYPAQFTPHDRVYIAPAELIDALHVTGLVHLHFHAQQPDNTEFAGPGPGDVRFANRFGLACLIMTPVASPNPRPSAGHTVNADLLFPGGNVLDLGQWELP